MRRAAASSRTTGRKDTCTDHDSKRKCFCFDQEHMKKDCQKRNSDMASAQRETEVPSLT